MNGHKYFSKTLGILASIAGATALASFPAAAQVNPNPSIFNEAPYNRSGQTSQSTPALGQTTGGSTGTQQVTPTDEPTGGSTMEQMQSPAGSTTETTGESDATIQRSTTVETETQIQRSNTTQPTQSAPATTQEEDQVSPTTGAEEEPTGATADEGVQGLW